MSAATFTFEHQLDKLEEEQQSLVEKATELRKFVTSPQLCSAKAIEEHTLENLAGELANSVVTLTSNPEQPAGVSSFPNNEDVELMQNLRVNSGSGEAIKGGLVKEPFRSVGYEDWKGKLVFIFAALAIIIAATVAGLVGPEVPVILPDGNYSTSSTTVFTESGSQIVTSIQTTTQPLLSAQWVVALWIFAGVLAFLPQLWLIIAALLRRFDDKEKEEELAAPEKISRYLSDKINLILQRYVGLVSLEVWQPATKENLSEYYIAETPEYVYSRSAQNRLLFANFAVSQINEILFICNEYIRQQRSILWQHIAQVNSASGGVSKLGGGR